MIESVLRSHCSRYPAMQAQDLYKLLHQAAMGGEHAVSDRRTAEEWLMRELKEMAGGNPEPMIDPISADGSVARIHLRPYLAAGHAPEQLLSAFLRTADEYRGDIRTLEEYRRAAVVSSAFPAAVLDEFFRSMQAQNYPAVHHSSIYQTTYHPAYRVVALEFCPKNWIGTLS